MPGTAPWRIIIIEDVDRMMERTTNVLLKEIEEPSPHTIWLLCAPSAQDVLPTIRSRTRIINLAVPSNQAVAKFLESQGFEPNIAARAARLSEGHIGIASLYAKDERVMTDRDELIVGVLGLHRASDAVLLAGNLIDNAKAQAEAEVNVKASEAEADFRRINGLGPKDRIPPKLRGAYNAIAKKDELKRRATRLTRDVLDRALNSAASIYRDVAVLQNNAEDAVGLINLENRSAITELSVRLDRTGAVRRLEDIATAMGQKGTMSALRRTAAGLYTEADAHTLEEILAAKEQGTAALEALMLPVESVFTPLPLLVVEPWVEQHLYNGCPTSRYPAADGRYRVRNAAGQFLGLANITGGVLRVEKLFVERN